MRIGWVVLGALAVIAAAVFASPLIAAMIAVTIVVFLIAMWPGKPRRP
jgi:hypothetical protein